MSDMNETTKTRKDSLGILLETQVWSLIPHITNSPPNSITGDKDCEYKLWERLDDPKSAWNTLHVEWPKSNERRRFSSYGEYPQTRNQLMKDGGQLFRAELREGGTSLEDLSVILATMRTANGWA